MLSVDVIAYKAAGRALRNAATKWAKQLDLKAAWTATGSNLETATTTFRTALLCKVTGRKRRCMGAKSEVIV
jgi:hypothetical protein